MRLCLDSILTEMQRITRMKAAEPWASGDSGKTGYQARIAHARHLVSAAKSVLGTGKIARSWRARRISFLCIEELRLIAAKRERLELELEAITTRLNARGEMGQWGRCWHFW